MNNNISIKTISELLKCNFHIPSYQRGYRWTEQQVTDLLNDINELLFLAENVPYGVMYGLSNLDRDFSQGDFIILTNSSNPITFLGKVVLVLSPSLQNNENTGLFLNAKSGSG